MVSPRCGFLIDHPYPSASLTAVAAPQRRKWFIRNPQNGFALVLRTLKSNDLLESVGWALRHNKNTVAQKSREDRPGPHQFLCTSSAHHSATQSFGSLSLKRSVSRLACHLAAMAK